MSLRMARHSPPRLLVISFDVIGTLIGYKGGSVGCQYLAALQQFLRENGKPDGELITSRVSTMEDVSMDAIRTQLALDRPAWVAAEAERRRTRRLSTSSTSGDGAAALLPVDPTEMPIGGTTAASVDRFWRQVLERAFHDPRVWTATATAPRPEGATAAAAAVRGLGLPDAAWEALYQSVSTDRFGTGKGYEWLPAAPQTLHSLSEWSVLQREKQEACASQAERGAVLTLAAPPFAVSNSDRRVRRALADLGAFSPYYTGDGDTLTTTSTTALLGEVVTAMDTDYAKPSPVGLERCLALAGIASAEDRARVVHIHVGDHAADRLACERASHRCLYLPCDVRVGVEWERLLETLQEVERM